MPLLIARGVRLAAILTLACAAYFSLRMAWADHLFHSGTTAGAGRALALEPDNAAYALHSGHPERAAALQPRLAEAWIELGLSAERNGHLEQAARHLEGAAAVDATYAPVWTLANFYARRRDHARFLAAAKRALRIGDPRHYDLAPLYRLAWDALPDPTAILIPGSPPLDLHSLLPYCDRLLAAGDADQAVFFWNAFIGGSAPRRPLLDPTAGSILTNGEFAWEPVEHGFDWCLPQIAHVSAIRLGPRGGLRITFDGRQAERCQVLEQWIPVTALTRYILRFRYRTEAIPPGAGPRWRTSDAVTRQEIVSDAAPVSSPVDADAAVRFTTASGTRLLMLTLVYDRVPGTTRIAGTLQLERVTLGREP